MIHKKGDKVYVEFFVEGYDSQDNSYCLFQDTGLEVWMAPKYILPHVETLKLAEAKADVRRAVKVGIQYVENSESMVTMLDELAEKYGGWEE